jgi:thioredoxin 1
MKITNDNFKSEVLESDIPVLLDFWAEWCGPCRMLSPVVEEVAAEREGKIKVGKVNVDEEILLANEFGVSSIPTVVILKGGKSVAKTVGYMPKAELDAFIDGALK